ncbi:MAG: DUF1810 domain-containing protein [Planctomycetaceae bacterium]|jgi:uncharacterized protein (DUF1810 family)|nr:DUF1810 domain-containing protein [Planctomycetaceae bacterium]
MNNNLERFIKAQNEAYFAALSEIQNGKKESHWMWYIFPQIAGLGFSKTSKYYAITDLEEAKAYFQHDLLGTRLIEISTILLSLPTNNANAIFGSVDGMKLHSSMTLFSQVENRSPVFQAVLDKFFAGKLDKATIRLLKNKCKKS